MRRSFLAIALSLTAVAISTIAGLAETWATNDRGSFVLAPKERFESPPLFFRGQEPPARPAALLYVNRCEGGCVLQPGFEDSRTDHSSIISSTKEISEWSHGDEGWHSMLECVRALYSPYNIIVTDQDPGNRPHFEALAAGVASEYGFPRAGGVAPFTCGVIQNAMTFTFANQYESMREICNVVGQESAHAMGLDHQLLCDDPMTYLGGCPIKAFQDADAPCGEFDARECHCGGTEQNSHQRLLEILSEGIAPEVFIDDPVGHDPRPVGFVIEGRASDDSNVTAAELWIDGLLIERREGDELQINEADPKMIGFRFEAPNTLRPGEHELEIRAFDDRHVYGSAFQAFAQEPCATRLDCDFAYQCVGGQCVLGPGNARGIGSVCVGNDDCESGVCATQAGDSFCTASCSLEPDSCPAYFSCQWDQGDSDMVCAKSSSAQGGCSSAASSSGPWWFVVLLLLCGKRTWYVGHREA